jgi:hypothetical protein
MSKPAAMLYRPLLAAAVRGAESLPAVERADVFEGIAKISARFDPAMSRDARHLADAIRTTEGLQLHFQNLFSLTNE